MYNYNQHLHFIGIGGVGMAGIAEVLLNLGYSLGGSDAKDGPLIQHLRRLGAQVEIGHRAENVLPQTSVVVVSSAIQKENVEMQEALARKIPVISRAEMLAELMRMKYGIAVAGSHGKTTTTSMTAKILVDCGFDPTVIIGGRLLSQTSGASAGTGAYLVAEADESDGSFNLLRPAIAIVTNIDAEHLGHYGSFGALEEAFRQFMECVPFYGLVVACFDDPVVARLSRGLRRRVLSYGLSTDCDISASDIDVHSDGSEFTLHVNGKETGRVKIPLLGTHMVSNALAAIAVGLELGAFPNEACTALRSFPGVARRSEVLFHEDGITVIDDYAHHPREITATLSAIRRGWLSGKKRTDGVGDGESDEGRLIVIFQPHRFTRTKELFSDFLTCFGDADRLILTEIYPAGEPEIPGISGQALAAAVQHPYVTFTPNLQDILSSLVPKLRPGDVVITVGAGSVSQLAHQISGILREQRNVANH
ncbi:MAG: UDP-N-acetylmuramate--L-alanine ligase [Bdellovibrionota bacterium]